jgi:hypothetical protein
MKHLFNDVRIENKSVDYEYKLRKTIVELLFYSQHMILHISKSNFEKYKASLNEFVCS